MTVTSVDIAGRIIEAHEHGVLLDASDFAISNDMAYGIQDKMTAWRLGRGEHQVGWKLGYTSNAMRQQMGVAMPNFGPLTDAMVLRDGAEVPGGVQPRVEPEIVLVLGTDVDGPLTAAQCREHVAEARLALEVVDSIWRDYSFTWAHNTADGSSAAYVVLGPIVTASDLVDVEVGMTRNGVEVGRGKGKDAMEDPYLALSWLTTVLAGHERGLRRGDFVITGGLCAAVPLEPGDVIAARAGGTRVRVIRAAD